MLEGRFNLGVGSGEALNEHISATTGPRPTSARDARGGGRGHAHAVEGGERSHYGHHYAVENARIYDLPDDAAAGHRLGLRAEGGPSWRRASATASPPRRPTRTSIDLYRSEGGKGPVQAGAKVCFMADEDEARETVHRLWPNEGLRRAGPDPADAGALRAGVRAGHARRALPARWAGPRRPRRDAAGVRGRRRRRAVRAADRSRPGRLLRRLGGTRSCRSSRLGLLVGVLVGGELEGPVEDLL